MHAVLIGVVYAPLRSSAPNSVRERRRERFPGSVPRCEDASGTDDWRLGDTSAPTRPRRLTLANATPTSVTVSWRRSSDNVGVAGYEVYLAGRPTMRRPKRRTPSTHSPVTRPIRVGVAALRHGRLQVSVPPGSRSRPLPARRPPPPPHHHRRHRRLHRLLRHHPLQTPNRRPNRSCHWARRHKERSSFVGRPARTTWVCTTTTSSGGLGQRCQAQVKIAETTSLSYVHTGLACGTAYSLALQAQDAAGNKSNLSEAIWYPVTTQAALACDHASSAATLPPPPPPPPPPPAIRSRRAPPRTSASRHRRRQASDSPGRPRRTTSACAGYNLYLNTVKVWTTPGTSFTHLGLTCGTTYTVAVQAYDAAGNGSPRHSSRRRPQLPRQKPNRPPSRASRWGRPRRQRSSFAGRRATDNVGVHHYNVFRGNSAAASASGRRSPRRPHSATSTRGWRAERRTPSRSRRKMRQATSQTSARQSGIPSPRLRARRHRRRRHRRRLRLRRRPRRLGLADGAAGAVVEHLLPVSSLWRGHQRGRWEPRQPAHPSRTRRSRPASQNVVFRTVPGANVAMEEIAFAELGYTCTRRR